MKARRLEPLQSARHLGIRGHGGQPIGELLTVGRGDFQAPGSSDFLEDRGADIGKWNIHVGDGQSLRVGDEFLEPKTMAPGEANKR
jgi:hypothetical protein